MALSLIYLVNRFFYRLTSFFIHWYWDSLNLVWRKTFGILRHLDQFFALKITFKNFFRPLYQDYTFIGYLFGIFFRFWRVFGALIIYSAIFLTGAAIYLVWIAIPIIIFYRVWK
ncbi:MAG: hypothetical protein AAB885_02505 [Patescibacteria group bacterium]